ncbi:unnamed protein product [Rotaria sordida]|uniref:Transposase n=1 Tax=Rotaria sordida TaxID=392033 RepID=A0A819LQI7_9BILA|nr:unnamed protein product [Rotaria sordida]
MGQSRRKVVLDLQCNNIQTKRISVQRIIKELNLKPFKLTKAQRKLGSRKTDSKWQWTKIINTVFPGIFTIERFHNNKNDREAPITKYPGGVIFWGGICTKSLIPHDDPINVTQWLQDQCRNDKLEDLNEAIFQDDQDSKHRTQITMDVVYDLFEERIESNHGDAKFADVWSIENVWRIMKEKTRGKTFENLDSLVGLVNSESQKIILKQCEAMIDNIPKRLAKVTQLNGNQVYEH